MQCYVDCLPHAADNGRGPSQLLILRFALWLLQFVVARGNIDCFDFARFWTDCVFPCSLLVSHFKCVCVCVLEFV